MSHLWRLVTAVSLVSVVAVAAACGPSSPPVAATGTASGTAPIAAPIAVLGAENFYADLLVQIGGSRVAATSLLNDPTEDPHAFEASPQAAKAVADARLVIVNGLGYDEFMNKLLDASPRPGRVVIDVQQVTGAKDDANAHLWYDPRTMPLVAEAAAAALTALEPRSAAYFADRKASYQASLQRITDKIGALKATYAGAPVAFTEPVAEYLAAAIGLTVLTPPGFMEAIEKGVDPAPADVAAERALLTGRKVKALLYNSQVTSPLTTGIRELAVQHGVPVVGVAETIPPTARTFVQWQLAQLDDLERALAKPSAP